MNNGIFCAINPKRKIKKNKTQAPEEGESNTDY